jgi:hypothetical protein
MTKVKVLGREIAIKFIDQATLDKEAEDVDVKGLYHNETIYLSDRLSGETLKRVFLHELVHSALGVSGVTNLLGKRREEAVCDLLECLSDVFQDPKVIDFISK